MVTWVRGSFKNVHGTLDFDPEHPVDLYLEAAIDANLCWSGEPARDEHLRSEDFLNCAVYPEIRFTSRSVELVGPEDFKVTGDLLIRGVSRSIRMDVRYHGTWQTPWFEDGIDRGPKTRAGFSGHARINRYDFGVSWNGELPAGGVVVSPDVEIFLDAEAILENE